MAKQWYYGYLFLLLCTFPLLTQAVVVSKTNQDYVAHEVLVQFKTTTKRVLRSQAMLGMRAKVKNRFHRMGLEHWTLPVGVDVATTVQQLRKNPAVAFAEPNYRRHLRALPNDPQFSQQWALQNTGQQINDTVAGIVSGLANADMALSNAWNTQVGNNTVVVAVIDDSVDVNHPDLLANIWTNPNEIPNDGIDNDANGYVDDVHGWDFVNNDNDPSADLNKNEGHGTTVAGCIGAVGNNGVGIAGVNWHVSIMPIKMLTDVASELLAFQYAINNGAHIINASWGGPQFSRAESNAVQLLQNAGILLVAAAGNYDSNNDMVPDYPSSLPNANVLAVGGSDPFDQLMGFTHYGALSVDVAAPGLSILTTASPNAGATAGSPLYDYASGTSFSSPYVAGIAALVKAQYPTATFQEMKGRILAGVTPMVSMQGFMASAGRANAASALAVSVQPVLMIKDIRWNDLGNGVPDAGEIIDVAIQLENVWQNATGIQATLVSLSANFTVLKASVNYPNLNTDAYANPLSLFQVKIANNITGQQMYRMRLDIQAAGGYAISRYYQLSMGSLQQNTTDNGTLMATSLDDMQVFHIDVPAGAGSLNFKTTSGSDLDLLVKRGSAPQFDYQLMIEAPANLFATGFNTQVSATIGSGNENIIIPNPIAGTWYATVLNFDQVATNYPYSITASYTAPSVVGTATLAAFRGGQSGCLLLPTASPFLWWLGIVFFGFLMCIKVVKKKRK